MTRYRPSAVAKALVCAILLAVLAGSARTEVGIASARTTTVTAQWTAKSLAPGRWWSAATFMPLTCELLAYGGDDFGNPTDTLIYSPDLDRWTVLSPQRSGGPPSLRHHGLSWDSINGTAVMFGGSLSNLTFGFDPSKRSWTQLIRTCTSTTCPSARRMHAQAWSTTLGATLVFGGVSTGSPYSAVTNDLWVLRAVPGKRGSVTWQWKRLTPKNDPTYGAPLARSRHGMAEIPLGPYAGKMLIYGGLNDKGETLSDTWLYDPATNAYQLLPSAGSPTPRHGFGMAYSPTLYDVVIQGGQTNSMAEAEVYTHETWAFDRYTAVWARVETNDPTGDRSYHDLVSNTCGAGSVIMFDKPALTTAQQPTWVLK